MWIRQTNHGNGIRKGAIRLTALFNVPALAGPSALVVVPFVHPGIMATALALGAIPILVHLINRRRYVRVEWAAMTFLLAARKKSAARVRFEHWLLMLVRMLVITGFGLAVARPYTPTTALLPLPSAKRHHVLVLDNSLSMLAQASDGTTSLERARSTCLALLESLPAGDAVSVVTTAAPAGAAVRASTDRRFVAERLAGLKSTERIADVEGAATKALELLGSTAAAPGSEYVYWISDFQRWDWQGVSTPDASAGTEAVRRIADALEDSSEQLTFIAVPPVLAENVTVSSLSVTSTLTAIGIPISLLVGVTNHGSTTIRNATLEIRSHDRPLRTEPLTALGPGETIWVSMTVEFNESGSAGLEARIRTAIPDALPQDDARRFSIEIPRSTAVLVVDGRPGSSRFGGCSGYLTAALNPGNEFTLLDGRSNTFDESSDDRMDPANVPSALIAPKVITESELAGEALSEYATVLFCNVASLPEEQWRWLAEYVTEGGGLMIFGGDRINSEHYNRYGYADGHGVLPGTLGAAVDTQVPPSEPAVSNLPAATKIRSERFTHPVVAEFTDRGTSGLFLSDVQRIIPLNLNSNRGEVLLSLTGGQPLLAVSSLGRGRTMFFASSANMKWTSLPAKGDFLTLLWNAVGWLAPRRDRERNLPVGGILTERLTASEGSLPQLLILPDGRQAEPSMVPESGELSVRYGPLDDSGLYTLSIGSVVRRFAVNSEPLESDLRSLGETELRTVLGRVFRYRNADARGGGLSVRSRRTELGSPVFCLVASLLVVEAWLAMAFHRGLALSPGR